ASAVSAQSSTVIPAPKVTGNPAGASYVATLPIKEGSPIRGSISAVTAPDGVGVKFSVSFSGLPATGGPFMYHIHEKPVPDNGNCTATGAHLDPYKRGEVPICDASKPETCQTGDLSGKHGNLTAQQWSQEYIDPYSSTIPGTPAFFGDLSFVLHLSNKTRIGCANFKVQGGFAVPSGGSSLPAPSAIGPYNTTVTVKPTGGYPVAPTSTSLSKPPQFTGAAAKVAGGAGAVLVAAAAMML
ncbi:Cu,Zn superoxide dismutase-like protein, partial [Setomelanomma holmii]